MQEKKLQAQATSDRDDHPWLHDRLAETFARDTPNPAVCVSDGFGVRVSIDRGRLVVADGLGTHRRERRYSRATHGLARLVVLSSAGTVGLDALRWCAGVGIGVVVLDPFGGELHLTSGGVGNDDPRLRRAQALAMATPAGFEATRYLIASKLAGQASVAKGRLSETGAATTIARLRDELEAAETLEEIRHVEAVAANVYWNAWSEIEVPFVRKDVSRVADHWRTFEGRRSAVNVGTSRSATDPANALLNYGYRLLEAEGRFACLAVGLDPGLGILHADLKGRDSMVLDIMEAVRPVVDGYVLDLFRARPLMKTDFAEDRRGVLRVLPPLTHRIAEAMPAWGKALAPVVEHVARILSTSSPYDVSVPSVLTRDKHKAAAARRVAAPAHSTQSGVLSPGPNPGGLAPRVKQRQRPSVSADRPCPVGLAAGADRSWPPWNRTMPRLDAGGATSVDRSAEPSWTTGCERRRASSQIGIVWRPTCSRRTPMKPSHAAGTRTGGASSPDLPGKQTTTVRRPTSVGTPNTSPRAWRICPSPRSPGRSASPRPQRASSEGACVFRRRDTGQHFPN